MDSDVKQCWEVKFDPKSTSSDIEDFIIITGFALALKMLSPSLSPNERSRG